MFASILLALAQAQSQSVVSVDGLKVDYQNSVGLTVSLNGIPLVMGSSFQYYEENWARGLFSSVWRPVVITPQRDGYLVSYDTPDATVRGTHRYTRTGNGVRGEFEFRWLGDKAVRFEHSASFLWATPHRDAALNFGGASTGLSQTQWATGTPEQRILGRPGRSFTMDGPLARVTMTVEGRDAAIFDARGYAQPWSEGREVLWFGLMNQPIGPGETVRYSINWTIEPKRVQVAAAAQTLPPAWQTQAVVRRAEAEQVPLFPLPKERADATGALEVRTGMQFSGTNAGAMQELFWRSVGARWQTEGALASGSVPVRLSVKNLGLKEEGYVLRVAADGVTVEGQDAQGLRHGVTTLAMLTRPQGGRLVVPFTTIRDWPSVAWRGVHMFVGPTALEFQTRLMDRVLAPAKFNNVVLQVERTNWRALPGTETNITMDRDDLARLFETYRDRQIEPIPLIQSLGHMGWFFANGQNLDLALNREIPFTIDPRKRAAQEKIREIWLEANSLLKPKTVHFGLDEFDMRGVTEDRFFSTRIWMRQVPYLMNLARELKVKPMVWSDMMLAPGEAIDAMNGVNPEQAKTRRSALTPGTMVADWHYANNPDPSKYTSLPLWKREGFQAIASHWYRPENIYGQTHAAIQHGAGILQTTWAGYESSEANMIREFDQFAAYLLAGEYAWSGRKERPGALPYSTTELLKRLYFDPPAPIRNQSGRVLGNGSALAVEEYALREMPPVRLRNILMTGGAARPESVSVSVGAAGREAVVVLGIESWLRENQEFGVLEVVLANGETVRRTLAYGQHARVEKDSRPAFLAERSGALTVVSVPLPVGAVVSEVRLRSTEATAGVWLNGVAVL